MNAQIHKPDIEPVDSRIEEYLAGRLDAHSQQQFELDMIASTTLQSQVRDAYALRELARAQPERWIEPRPQRPQVLALALAASVGALAAGLPLAWWAQQNLRGEALLADQVGQLQAQIAGLGQPQLGVPVVHLGPLRSLEQSSAPVLRQQPGVNWVRLSVDAALLDDAAVDSDQLALLGPAGSDPWELSGEHWTVEDGQYSLLLPLARLQPGLWQLQVERQGRSSLSFPFEVQRVTD